MKNRPTLFEVDPPTPRAKPRVMMHVIDAGGCDNLEGGAHIVVFQCGKCRHKTEWQEVQTVSEGKRGFPCPKCNGGRF